ncbi:hypothetical protein CIPAW_08G145200 [Carya illinoinensis]|uniref:ABC transporter domain-containing protein n=1 Tax=Carya illinoinensis TaxID=32201 RepID=A0A8T1PZP6_CARIL|nr:hypothetical protein CIPAW_08G145200 [Carya illinoinensis]
MASTGDDHHREMVIDIGKLVSFTGGLEFSSLIYTVKKEMNLEEGKSTRQAEVDLMNRITGYAPKGCITAKMGSSGVGKSTLLDGLAGRIAYGSLKGRVSLDGMETSPRMINCSVYETLMFAANFRLGLISTADKQQHVEQLIEQLGLSISDEGMRGVSGGERQRVSIGVDIIHGPSLLFLDKPTSGLDSTSAHSIIEKVHHIAHLGNTLFLDHLRILVCSQLMYQGSPKDVAHHLARIGRKVPKGENSVEYLIDVIQQYDQSELGVEVLAKFALTSLKPLPLADKEIPVSSVAPTCDHKNSQLNNNSKSWSASDLGVLQALRLTSSRTNQKVPISMSLSPGYYYQSLSEIIARTPQSSDYTVNESNYLTHEDHAPNSRANKHPGPKFANSFFLETMILMRCNFKNIYRTPKLFLSILMVLTVMGITMATMFKNPKPDLQGITNRISFFIFTVCLFFFSSNDAVPAFIQERFIFIRETSHNAYRASSYTIAGLITYLHFLALQATVYAGIVCSVVPNYILGYAAVIAFTALFFLFYGYFLNSHDIPIYWKWMNKISTMTYRYEGLLMNQYQTDDSFGTNTNGEIVSGFCFTWFYVLDRRARGRRKARMRKDRGRQSVILKLLNLQTKFLNNR